MGDETTQFASRFTAAVDLLSRIVTDEGLAAARRRHGARLDGAIADALDAIAAVHETGTEAVKRWSERRSRVLAAVADLRSAVGRSGVDAAARGKAQALVTLLGEEG